ncbi:MAG: T9SS type A sorting domain-containing protein [Flavobacteriales bacterium]|nr:T9SS type A sorting domain-containing protein [Flavobacteriales bacterium]
MRIATLTLAALCAAFTAVQAQSFHRLDAAHSVQAVLPTVDMTGEEIIPYQPLNAQNLGDIDHLQLRDMVIERQVIGYTQYDLQSNYAVDDRVFSSSNGLSAGWIQSLETSPFGDRGTGYNHKDAGTGADWGEIPYDRIEDVRIGWPSLGHLANGSEFALSHGSTGGLVFATRDAVGSGEWSTTTLPALTAEDETDIWHLWPRATVGGADGNSIHAICISAPAGNGGVLYNGQDGALIYMRSTDGGANWDIETFAELDTASFGTGFVADSYAIHAEGDKVAFAVFNGFYDTFAMVSEDNGDTWTYETIVDFPVDNYVLDSGALLDTTIADAVDANGNAMFFNADRAGDVLVDEAGGVHVFFGAMFYADSDTTDATSSYYPFTNGLEYWRPDMGPDSSMTIAYAYDIDESGTLDYEDEIAGYFVGISSQPSAGQVVESNTIVVAYSALMENFSTGIQNYRHCYVVHSTDLGETWNSGTACDVTPDLDFDLIESVYPCIPQRIQGGEVNLTYQRDFEPGLHVRGDEDPIDINDIVGLTMNVEDLGDCADVEFEDYVGVGEIDQVGFGLFPNPADAVVEIVLDDLLMDAEVSVRDMGGRLVRQVRIQGKLARLDVSDLTPGIYTVEVSGSGARSIERLSIR